MRFADIDLSRLPAPDVVKRLSFEDQLAEMKAQMIVYGDEIGIDFRDLLEVEADVVLKLLQAWCARELYVRGDMNDQAKAVMPAFAIGSDLVHMAARNGVTPKVLVPANPDAIPPTEAVMERDDDLRARMQLALEAFSTAGPEGAYLFHILAVDGVRDGGVYSHEDEDVVPRPEPAEVVLVILAASGDGTADAGLLDSVRSAVSKSEVRPLADKVIVQSAEVLEYEIKIELMVLAGSDPALAEARARAQLEGYTDRNFAVARAHRLTGIGASAHIFGAVDEVIITSPEADILPAWNQAARCTGITITTTQVAGAWNA